MEHNPNKFDNRYYTNKLHRYVEHLVNIYGSSISNDELQNDLMTYLCEEEQLKLAALFMMSADADWRYEFLCEPKNADMFTFMIGMAMESFEYPNIGDQEELSINAIHYIGNDIIDYSYNQLEKLLKDGYYYAAQEMDSAFCDYREAA